MERSVSGKRINTVLGEIDSKTLGFTLMHEHIIVNPQIPSSEYDPYRLVDEDRMKCEVNGFVDSGGNTILDAAPLNFGRDVDKLERISSETDCNILFASGFHKQLFLPDYVRGKSVDELCEILLKEIVEGVGQNRRKPAVLKFGTSLDQITEDEKKCIAAVCKAHHKTGLPIITHTEKGTAGQKQVEELLRHEVNPERVILGHLDLNLNIEYLRELCRLGVNIQFDHFGRGDLDETSRIKALKTLIDEGFIGQIFISGDMGKKNYLPSYGGSPGFKYFTQDLRKKFADQISDEAYQQIMINNVRIFFEREA